jgi:hypothetical protein
MPIFEPIKKPTWLKPGTHSDLKFKTYNPIDISGNKLPLQPIRVGGFAYSNIYIGGMKLNGKKKTVAIKRFNMKLNDELAQRYQQTINDLLFAGVRLPKMGMVKLPKGTKFGFEELENDEWVQISEFFGKKENGQYESKIVNKSGFLGLTENQILLALIELIKVVNAGYVPQTDFIEPFKYKDYILPFDLDLLANRGKKDTKTCVKSLLILSKYSKTIPFKLVLELVQKYGTEETKRATQELLSENLI